MAADIKIDKETVNQLSIKQKKIFYMNDFNADQGLAVFVKNERSFFFIIWLLDFEPFPIPRSFPHTRKRNEVFL